VWVSNDGNTWTQVKVVNCTTTYTDYTIDLGGSYTYVKLQATGAQVRIPYFVVTFKED